MLVEELSNSITTKHFFIYYLRNHFPGYLKVKNIVREYNNLTNSNINSYKFSRLLMKAKKEGIITKFNSITYKIIKSEFDPTIFDHDILAT